jgi:hypothetical protein
MRAFLLYIRLAMTARNIFEYPMDAMEILDGKCDGPTQDVRKFDHSEKDKLIHAHVHDTGLAGPFEKASFLGSIMW